MLNHKIAILGLGETGLSCVNFLLRQGMQGQHISVFDTRQSPPGQDKLNPTVNLIKGELSGNLLAQFKLIIASPGIALATPALQFAASNGSEIIGDIELFARQLRKPEYRHAKLVTITGSNGKSTVTSLVGEMAVEANVKVAVGGNIGVPALDLLAPEINLYILELSSFQLETTSSLHADIATILNVSEDHMDRYDCYADYVAAKQRIYEHSKMVLFNRDDNLTYPQNDTFDKVSFGFDQLDYGLLTDLHNSVFLAKQGTPILAVQSLQLSGKHNWLNALAAVALGSAVGLSEVAMLTALQQYSGLPHRCEFVAKINNVRWVNDSKATNVGATLAALLGLSETITGNVHVILGGDGKGDDFSALAAVLNEIQGLIVCFGADRQKIAKQNTRALLVDNLEQAVYKISKMAQPGDLVILSPACASLDMYKNFIARGEHFKRLVNSLAVGKSQ